MAIKFDARGGRLSRVKAAVRAADQAVVEPAATVVEPEHNPVAFSPRNLLATIADPAFLLDADRKLLCANHGFYQLFSLDEEIAADMPDFAEIARLCSMRGGPELLAIGAFNGAADRVGETRIQTQDRKIFTVRMVHGADGSALYVFSPETGAQPAVSPNDNIAAQMMENLPGIIVRLRHSGAGIFDGEFTNRMAKEFFADPARHKFTEGASFAQIIVAEDREKFSRALADSASSDDQTFDLEFRIASSNGAPTWMRGIGNSAQHEDGTWYSDMRIAEIDHRIRVSQERDRLREMLDMVVDNIPYMVSVWDAKDLSCLYVNRAVEEATGQKREELEGGLDMGAIKWTNQEERLSLIDQMLETGEPVEYPEETAFSPTLGERIYKTRRFPLGTEGEEIEYILSISEDLTDQRRTELVARRTETQFRDAVENITDGIALFDEDERLVQCNRRYVELWPGTEDVAKPGEKFETIIRALVATQNPSDPDKHVEARLAQFRHAPSVREIELMDNRWVQVTDTPTSDGGTVVTCTDITALKEREARLRDVSQDALHAKETAEFANRSKSDFLAIMSHELRTPLNAIIGFSEIIKDCLLGDDPMDQYKAYAQDIYDSGTHLLALINDILDMSRIESGKAELSEDPICVPEAIETSIRLVEERALKQRITIERDFSGELPQLNGDLRKLKQILINLLSNSVKFTEDNGNIQVSVKIDENGAMRIAVTDNGIGILEEDLTKVLEPFGQADAGLDRQFEGTGLGLTLTKALVELHGGRFTLESATEGPDKGTTASAVFPPQRLIKAG